MEKMPSASNSPMTVRKASSEDVNSKKGQPLSVASMVRRFERDSGLGDKNRGGELERSNSSLNKESSKLPVKESRSSSQNSSLGSSQGNLPDAAIAVEAASAEAEVKSTQQVTQKTSAVATTKTSVTAESSAKPSKTVRNFEYLHNSVSC